MPPRFFDEDDYDAGFDPVLEEAAELEAQLLESAPAFARHVFDITFASDDPKKLTALAKQLTGVGYRMTAPARADDGITCTGTSMPLPVAEDTVCCWAIDLYVVGFEYDCTLTTYAPTATVLPPDDTLTAEQRFAAALAAFERGNRGLAIALFSHALAVEPGNPNTWYSRGCVEDTIDLAQHARRDYDKAIELAPRFVAALVNRGVNKDAADEFAAAIEDYDRAIAINDKNDAAFLNRGNSKHNAGDEAGALADWKIAAGLGSALAKKRLASKR